MDPTIETLLALQNTDLNILQLKKRIEKVEKSILALRENLQRESTLLEDLRKKQEKEKLNLAEQELELKEIEEKLDSSKQKLYGGEITSSKELSQWEKNMESFEKSRDNLENSVLQQMETVEAGNRNLRQQEQSYALLEKESSEALNNHIREKQEIEKKLIGLKHKRNQLIQKLSPQALTIYEELSGRYPDPVASLQGETCTGCHLALPTSTVKNIRKDGGVNRCPNCGRFIYSPS